jgi:hypothetical protein
MVANKMLKKIKFTSLLALLAMCLIMPLSKANANTAKAKEVKKSKNSQLAKQKPSQANQPSQRQQLKDAMDIVSKTSAIQEQKKPYCKFAFIDRLTGESVIFDLETGEDYELAEKNFNINLKSFEIVESELETSHKAAVKLKKVANDRDYNFEGELNSSEPWNSGIENGIFAVNLILCNDINEATAGSNDM